MVIKDFNEEKPCYGDIIIIQHPSEQCQLPIVVIYDAHTDWFDGSFWVKWEPVFAHEHTSEPPSDSRAIQCINYSHNGSCKRYLDGCKPKKCCIELPSPSVAQQPLCASGDKPQMPSDCLECPGYAICSIKDRHAFNNYACVQFLRYVAQHFTKR